MAILIVLALVTLVAAVLLAKLAPRRSPAPVPVRVTRPRATRQR